MTTANDANDVNGTTELVAKCQLCGVYDADYMGVCKKCNGVFSDYVEKGYVGYLRALLARHDDELARMRAFVERVASVDLSPDHEPSEASITLLALRREAKALRPASADADGQREDGT